MEELQEFRQELHHQVHLKELDINREEGELKGRANTIKDFISRNPKINNYKEIALLFGYEESYVRKLLTE